MFEGKERRQQLIQELRTTHALQLREQKIQQKEAQEIAKKTSLQEKEKHKVGSCKETLYQFRMLQVNSALVCLKPFTSMLLDVPVPEKCEPFTGFRIMVIYLQNLLVQDGMEAPAALILGEQLDFLNRELVRLQEERRIAAFVMLAERERRMREAEESGHRQREERLRRTEDEVFKQMMRVHRGTVDTYLEDVILQSMDRMADKQAREEIAKQARTINELAQKFEHT